MAPILGRSSVRVEEAAIEQKIMEARPGTSEPYIDSNACRCSLLQLQARDSCVVCGGAGRREGRLMREVFFVSPSLTSYSSNYSPPVSLSYFLFLVAVPGAQDESGTAFVMALKSPRKQYESQLSSSSHVPLSGAY